MTLEEKKALIEKSEDLVKAQRDLTFIGVRMLALELETKSSETEEIRVYKKVRHLVDEANKLLEPYSEDYYQHARIEMLYGTIKKEES